MQESQLLPEHGQRAARATPLWRSLAAIDGEIVVFLDSDTEEFDDRFLRGLLGPLLAEPAVAFVKGAFRRPFKLGDTTVPDGGGRITELVARPLLNLHAPQLASFVPPLAGEFAARRTLLEQLAFPVGYGVEIATLIDAFRLAGLDALAQVNLGVRQNRHQSLRVLERGGLCGDGRGRAPLRPPRPRAGPAAAPRRLESSCARCRCRSARRWPRCGASSSERAGAPAASPASVQRSGRGHPRDLRHPSSGKRRRARVAHSADQLIRSAVRRRTFFQRNTVWSAASISFALAVKGALAGALVVAVLGAGGGAATADDGTGAALGWLASQQDATTGLVRSFDIPSDDPDRALAPLSFTYDDALAALAFTTAG